MTREYTNDWSKVPQVHITEAGRPDRTVAVRGTTTIGRDSDNDIVLTAWSVSRCHAVLLRDVAGVRLLDLESTNGTLVNGLPALPDEPVQLADGDLIQLGQVALRYHAAAGEGGNSPRRSEPASRHPQPGGAVRSGMAAVRSTIARPGFGLGHGWRAGSRPLAHAVPTSLPGAQMHFVQRLAGHPRESGRGRDVVISIGGEHEISFILARNDNNSRQLGKRTAAASGDGKLTIALPAERILADSALIDQVIGLIFEDLAQWTVELRVCDSSAPAAGASVVRRVETDLSF
jgi:hypothetical protein